jgi:hypothetical protein
MTQNTRGGGADFSICPHCWQVNPPSRFCARCLADITTVLQESGGRRWVAPAQSPVPVRGRERLNRWQRRLLFCALLAYGVVQIAAAFGGAQAGALFQQRPPAPAR